MKRRPPRSTPFPSPPLFRSLVGFVPLHRLLTADPRTPIHAIRNADVESVAVDTDQEEVARLVERYDLVQVPVVDADRKSTRLNSSHLVISYAVFCLQKKNYT